MDTVLGTPSLEIPQDIKLSKSGAGTGTVWSAVLEGGTAECAIVIISTIPGHLPLAEGLCMDKWLKEIKQFENIFVSYSDHSRVNIKLCRYYPPL